jgi:hypothetical protein
MFQTVIHYHVCQSSNVIDHSHILADDWMDIDTSDLTRGAKAFKKALENIDEVFGTTMSVPGCVIWHDAPAASRYVNVDDRKPPARTTPNSAPPRSNTWTRPPVVFDVDSTDVAHPAAKRQKFRNDPNADRTGFVIFEKAGNMPFPQALGPTREGGLNICKAYYRTSHSCRHDPCPYAHIHPKDLPSAAWVEFYEWATSGKVEGLKLDTSTITADLVRSMTSKASQDALRNSNKK